MKHTFLFILCLYSLAGCGVIRSIDESVSSTLETIPLLKMMGVESRKSQEEQSIIPIKPMPDDILNQKDKKGVEGVLILNAAKWINLNPLQNPSPVRLLVFELRETDKFLAAESNILINSPENVLGQTVGRIRQIIIAPGENIPLRWSFNEPGYIGIIADFRTAPESRMAGRQLIAFDGENSSTWEILISGNSLFTMINVSQKSSFPNLFEDHPLTNKSKVD
jgi:type VI secretion system VasD/TssJ family lipoprotein